MLWIQGWFYLGFTACSEPKAKSVLAYTACYGNIPGFFIYRGVVDRRDRNNHVHPDDATPILAYHGLASPPPFALVLLFRPGFVGRARPPINA
jgi:hypothetical protein